MSFVTYDKIPYSDKKFLHEKQSDGIARCTSMPIPPLTRLGILPAGLHDTMPHEIEKRFGRFNGSNMRMRLFGRLVRFLEAVRRWGNVEEILVGGSFITEKQRPTDIDIILVYRADFDLRSTVRPEERNFINRRRAKRAHTIALLSGFDVVAVTADSPERQEWLGYFSADARTGLQGKGLLRIRFIGVPK